MKRKWKWQVWCGRCRVEELGLSRSVGAWAAPRLDGWVGALSGRSQVAMRSRGPYLKLIEYVRREEFLSWFAPKMLSLSPYPNPAHSDQHSWPLLLVLKGLSDSYSALIWETHFLYCQPRLMLMVPISSGLLKHERTFWKMRTKARKDIKCFQVLYKLEYLYIIFMVFPSRTFNSLNGFL